MEITPYATLRVVKKNWRGTMVSLYSTLFLIIFIFLIKINVSILPFHYYYTWLKISIINKLNIRMLNKKQESPTDARGYAR